MRVLGASHLAFQAMHDAVDKQENVKQGSWGLGNPTQGPLEESSLQPV